MSSVPPMLFSAVVAQNEELSRQLYEARERIAELESPQRHMRVRAGVLEDAAITLQNYADIAAYNGENDRAKGVMEASGNLMDEAKSLRDEAWQAGG